MPIRAMHNSSVIHSESDEWDATVSYVAVVETTQQQSVQPLRQVIKGWEIHGLNFDNAG